MKKMYLNPDHLNDTCQKVQNHILASTTMTTLTLDLSTEEKYTTSITKHYAARYYKKRLDDKEYEFSYVDLPRLSVNDIEDMYLLQFQDKLHHLPLEFVKDFNNSLLMFIRRTVIKNKVEGKRLDDYDVKSSTEMLKKIDETLRHREHLRRLKEYVGGRPKTINPHTLIRLL
ncbi:hypothetical protein Tco_1172344 [Tanacetum coccineum]